MIFQHKKRFGQHFLKDQHVLSEIVDALEISPDQDFCLEIGPGQGALTWHLLQKKVELKAIEIDQDLKPRLDNMSSQHKQFSYLMADVLTVDFSQFFLGKPVVKIVGNLPYEISTPLLFQLLSVAADIDRMVFLLQKEVVDRIVAAPGSTNYGRLSVMLQYFFHTTALIEVPAEAFSPPPKVHSQVVMLRSKPFENIDIDYFSNFVKYLFAQKRKMLRQRFKHWVSKSDWDNLSIADDRRPGELSQDEILQLMTLLQNKGVVFK